jgi:hypothetical protein
LGEHPFLGDNIECGPLLGLLEEAADPLVALVNAGIFFIEMLDALAGQDVGFA